jgi:hypothetical protein
VAAPGEERLADGALREVEQHRHDGELRAERRSDQEDAEGLPVTGIGVNHRWNSTWASAATSTLPPTTKATR